MWLIVWIACGDLDVDGVRDGRDACQGFDDALDADGDALPDGCDPPDDTDADGVPDAIDRCAGDDRADLDQDTVPDACDPCPRDARDDRDGDGLCDSDDACPDIPNGDDQDSDGLPDRCDPCPTTPDTDHDGICDENDRCPLGDDRVDVDHDDVPDACDPCPTGADSDHDGVCDTADQCPDHPDGGDCPWFGPSCSADLPGRTPPSGQIAVTDPGAIAPLCSGHVWVASSSDPRVDLYDVVTGQIIDHVDTERWIWDLRADPTRGSLYVLESGLIERFDQDGHRVARYEAPSTIEAFTLGDGDVVFALERIGYELAVLDADTLVLRRRVQLGGSFGDVAFDRTHSAIFVAARPGSVWWDIERYDYRASDGDVAFDHGFVDASAFTSGLAVSPDGHTVLGACVAQRGTIFDSSNLGHSVVELPECGAPTFDPRGRWLLTVSDLTIAIRDGETLQSRVLVHRNSPGSTAAGWSLGSRHAFVANWDADDSALTWWTP